MTVDSKFLNPAFFWGVKKQKTQNDITGFKSTRLP